MHFDVYTLGVVGLAIGIAISLSFTLLGLVLRGLPALRVWAIAFWMLTVAALAQGLDENHTLMSAVVGSSLIALANALMLMGIAIHVQYPLRWRWPLAVAGLFVVNQVWFYLQPPSDRVEALVFGAHSVVWDTWMIWLLLMRSPFDLRKTSSFTAIVFFIDVLFYILRSSVLLFPQAPGDAPLGDLLTSWNYLFGILCSFLLSTGFTLMLAERLTLNLKHMASTDSLTGLLNRAAMLEQGARTVDAYRQRGELCCVLLFDLDNFKAINDCWGHAAGDAVLQHFADEIRLIGLPSDALFARYGGEEFVLLLPGVSTVQASVLAERMRLQVAKAAVMFEDDRIEVTTSVGVAASQQRSFEGLVNAADEALYRAKNLGRNRVEWEQSNLATMSGGWA